MGLRPGKKAERRTGPRRRPGRLSAVGRGAGFAVLAAVALAIQAAVVLLPEYAELRQERYALACRAATVADMEALADAQDRLIAKLPTDPVLTKRIAMNQRDHWPDRSVVVVEPGDEPSRPPYALRLAPHPRPQPPAAWLLQARRKLAKPGVRRGLWAVSAGLLAAAMFLFSPPRARTPHRKKAPPGGA